MKIRLRLTLQFVLISALITFTAFVIIYALSANYRQEQFYNRLIDKGINTAKLLVDVEEIDENLLRIIDENTANLIEERIFIYDYNNRIVYKNIKTSPEPDVELLNKVRLDEDLRFVDDKRESIGILYTGNFDRFVVLASAFDKYGLSKLNNLAIVLTFVFTGILIFTFIGGWIFSGQALKPITHVIEEVKQINDQSLGMRVNEGNGKDEIADLAKTFNLMLQRLEEAFFSQKSFVSHASHELRTPLTAITGQIEVALMKARTEEEYRDLLNSVLDDIQGLSKLTNGLLELVQASSAVTISNFNTIRLDDILYQSIEQAQEKYRSCTISMDFNNFPENEEDLLVRGNEYLLKTAFFNLLDNGCKFSGGKEIKVSLEQVLNSLNVSISDKGIGIVKEDQERIFQPFFRSANASKHQGYGLGLPLTKRILDMHEAVIQLHSSPDQGTVFTIIFPKVKL